MPVNRDNSIDLVKTIAILGVLVIHACTWGGGNAYPSFGYFADGAFGILFRASVPLFLMASGALMLNPAKPLPLKKLFGQYLLRIVIAMWFWAFLYKLSPIVSAGDISLRAFLRALGQVLVFDQYFHLYYLHMIIIVYLALPFLRVFTARASERDLLYFLAFWLVFAIAFPSFREFVPLNLLVGLPSSQWALNLTYCSIGYAVLGHYIKNHPVKPLAGALAFLAGLAVTGGATLAGTVIRGELYENFLNGNTLGVCLMAIGLFALCARARELPERVGGALRFIGKGSFGVYLSHLLFLHVLFPPLGITRSMLPAPLGLLAVVFLTLAASLALYFVLSKLPFAKKWLV